MLSKIVILLATVAVAFSTPVIQGGTDRQGRVVGGSGVTLGQVPSMASIRSLTNVHFCGGTIITNRWVLTSAQCVAGKNNDAINVVVGSITLNAGGVTHRSFNITRHPSFNPLTQNADLALIYTATVITLTANVQTIGLSTNMLGGGVSAQISGWGSTLLTGGIAPNNLQRMTTTTITNPECRSRFNPENAARIGDSKMCTLTRSGEGTCFGDEGGALIAAGTLAGILSWQIPCGTGVPDVYERVSNYRLWIMSITG